MGWHGGEVIGPRREGVTVVAKVGEGGGGGGRWACAGGGRPQKATNARRNKKRGSGVRVLCGVRQRV